ncbi:MAG: hypothetical protein ABIZ04_24200 [Opitutus sp.]
MGFPALHRTRLWLLLPVCAVALLLWSDHRWIQRVEAISRVDSEEATLDAASPTGYAGRKRWLIVPEHNLHSYEWIAQTQQMFAQKTWRVRQLDYENVPAGREVHAPSPYRWWLGLVAEFEQKISGKPIGWSVERAALFANPLLHFFLLVASAVFVGRRFGLVAAAVFTTGLATFFPLASAFLPGVPDSLGLAQICALWSVLPLVALARDGSAKSLARTTASFWLGGFAGGIGLWIDAGTQLPIIGGIFLGGLLAAAVSRRSAQSPQAAAEFARAWRGWALTGAGTCLVAYLIEYFPRGMDLRLQVNHPLYGLAWLGAGELLAQFTAGRQSGVSYWTWRRVVLLVLSLGAIAALPVVMVWAKSSPPIDLLASRLTSLPNGATAGNLAKWIVRDGITGPLIATLLPLLLLIPALWLLVRRSTTSQERSALALVLGPAVIGLAYACHSLRWWTVADTLLLVLMVPVLVIVQTRANAPIRALCLGVLGVSCFTGGLQFLPPSSDKTEFTPLEVTGLTERGLAHWLADHGRGPSTAVLAPPEITTTLSFYGGFRGLGTPNWENRDGVATTVQIITATTSDQAQAILNDHGVTHIVLPSWDSDLENFVTWTIKNPNDSFLSALRHWAVLPWLRPLPYKLPVVAGMEDRSVAIFELTDESSKANALSRIAEYFVETEQGNLADSANQSLLQFPADLGAMVARAHVAKLHGDEVEFEKLVSAVASSVSAGLDRTLPWERRVSLAIVLAQGKRTDLARKQVQRCITEMTTPRVRSLTTGSLFRLLVLSKAFDQPIPDRDLREVAQRLVPAELRGRF